MCSAPLTQPDGSAPEETGASIPLQISEDIRLGKDVDDASFDRIYPPWARRLSSRFWTPVEVARRAAALLAPDKPARVLDVGAGVGKLCAIGALVTGASFVGIEQRERLVELGRRSLSAMGITNARIEHGTLASVDFDAFDALYFFNPFEENLFTAPEQIDRSIQLSDDRFWEDVALSERVLSEAKIGTRVVTYHGFGGKIPASYRLMTAETFGGGYLRLWVKAAESEPPKSA